MGLVRGFVGVTGLLSMIAAPILALAYGPRYLSWRNLSDTTVTEAAQAYLDTRARTVSEIVYACVYAVECGGTRARLVHIPDLDSFDFVALRNVIWARRFDGVCDGRTANLGLHLIREPENPGNDRVDLAIWSFRRDRFVSRVTNWSSRSFSEEPWERCTPDAAVFAVQDGKLTRN